MKPDTYYWIWCPQCLCWVVECPACGNNCCNGGYGEVDGRQCTDCKDAYKFQDEHAYLMPYSGARVKDAIGSGTIMVDEYLDLVIHWDMPEDER